MHNTACLQDDSRPGALTDKEDSRQPRIRLGGATLTTVTWDFLGRACLMSLCGALPWGPAGQPWSVSQDDLPRSWVCQGPWTQPPTPSQACYVYLAFLCSYPILGLEPTLRYISS